MELEYLPQMEATVSEGESAAVLAAICCKNDWVAYYERDEILTLYLIRRFLAGHARNFGLLTETMIGSTRAVGVIRFRNDMSKINEVKSLFLKVPLVEGAIFLNGAVVRMSHGEAEEHVLFVSKEDAEFWGYPNTYMEPSTFNED